MLAQAVGLSTARDVWKSFEKTYFAQSQDKILSLKYQLDTLKKGSLPIAEYVQKRKSIANNLAAMA